MPYTVHVADETGQIIKSINVIPDPEFMKRMQAFNEDDTLDISDAAILAAAPDWCPFDCESCHEHVAPED